MANNRIERTNDDIQRVLADLLRNIKDPRVAKSMVSITDVKTTGDLRYAQVFVSALNAESEKELMKGLKSASGFLRHELGANLNLRYTPELQFRFDESIQHGAYISKIINSLDIPKEDEEDGISDTEDNVDDDR